MSATPGEHGPASAACCPACGTMEAWTTAAAGTSLGHLTSLIPTVNCLISRETGVTVSQHSQWTAIPWDCTVKQDTIARWTTCAFEHFMTSLPLSTRVQTNRARFVNLLTCVSRSRPRIIHVHIRVLAKRRRQGAVDQPRSAGAPVHDFLLQHVRFHYGLPRDLHPGNVRRKREHYLGAVRQQGACLERGTLEHQWGGPIPRELSSAMRSDVTSVPQYCHVGLATNIT